MTQFFDSSRHPWNNPRVQPPLQKVLCALVFAAWMAPAASALGVSLHLAVEHHHGPNRDHATELAEMLTAATHGHHHEADASARHEQGFRIEKSTSTARFDLPLAGELIAASAPPRGASERLRPDGSLLRAPPDSLFGKHCSLLL